MTDPVEVAGRFPGHELRCPICGEALEVLIITQIASVSGRRVAGTGVSGNTPVISVDITPGEFRGRIDHTCAKVETRS